MILFFMGFLAKNKAKKRYLFITVVAGFLFFTNTVIFSEICRQWEHQGTKYEEVQDHDFAVVLTGFAKFNTDLDRIELHIHGDRIWQAVTLYHQKKVKKILISGDTGYITDRGLHEAAQIEEILISWGIPDKDIIVESISKNTYENARESVAMLKRSYPHLKTGVLVTSGTHMKRALACFDKQGLELTPFATDPFTGESRNYFIDQYLIPDAGTLFYWESLTKEWLGMLTYKIMGYC